ncbi:hypothetical protein M413DRAFT_16491 [Hebeloma cylindrosporum]|uniref:CFA20 domain-containing protein n=1 Tax=Hebeloma cylindrosporum TaxID=76867 RepID=A0A0C3CDS0_HEBCY|nr:hypothetical protein M413DRAFT_16491 [Hebeloma cylindrosporum h7]
MISSVSLSPNGSTHGHDDQKLATNVLVLRFSIQPSTISLFSSTGSDPLALFGLSVDKALSSDSFIHLIHDQLSKPLPLPPKTLLHLPTLDSCQEEEDFSKYGRELDQTVLHIQSPTIRTTYIQCPPSYPRSGMIGRLERSDELGIKHPWMHLQVRNLGREWSFEVGLVDHAGRAGILRFATFQKKPRLTINRNMPGSSPILSMPLSFPSPSSRPLTPWSTINIHFPSILPYLSSQLLHYDDQHNSEEGPGSKSWPSSSNPRGSFPTSIPSGTYSYVSYVRVYATCRLRRIWFGESGPTQKVPWEFELYSAD